MQFVSAIAASVAAIAASTSAFFATRTFRVARKATVRDKFISSLGDLIAQLFEMSRVASRYSRQPELIATSRDVAEPTFRAVDAAVSQIRILEPSLNLKASEKGGWLLETARSLAADVLQADEFANENRDLGVFDLPPVDEDDEEVKSMRVAGISDEDWEILRYSGLYNLARLSEYDPPSSTPYMDETFEQSMRKHALDINKYGVEYDYAECCRRIIVHFVDNVLVPWGAYVVQKRLS